MGRSRTTHAGRARTEKQDWFVRLIAQGVSNREACRIVGINRRTGTGWRLGRTIRNTAGEAVHYPPVRIVTPPKRHPRYLSLDARMVIADLWREKRTVREIARELGRSPATVSRELRRNVDDRGRYLPRSADRVATERIARPRARRVMVDTELRAVVVDLLGKRWSPEQVAHELRERFGDQPAPRLCTESIYQAIYDPDAPVTCPAKRPPSPPAASRPRSGTTRPTDRDDDDRRPSGRGGRPNPGRALGGRLRHGSREPVSDRHSP
jgi:transposase, IS30 family